MRSAWIIYSLRTKVLRSQQSFGSTGCGCRLHNFLPPSSMFCDFINPWRIGARLILYILYGNVSYCQCRFSPHCLNSIRVGRCYAYKANFMYRIIRSPRYESTRMKKTMHYCEYRQKILKVWDEFLHSVR